MSDYHLVVGTIKIRWDHVVIEVDPKRVAPSEGRARKKGESPNATRCTLDVDHGEYKSRIVAYAYLNPLDRGRWSYSTGRKLSLGKALNLLFFGKESADIRGIIWREYSKQFLDAGRLVEEQKPS